MDDENQPLLVGADELALLDAEAAQIIGAAALQEMQVAGVIDEAGEIGIFIIDPLDEAGVPPPSALPKSKKPVPP